MSKNKTLRGGHCGALACQASPGSESFPDYCPMADETKRDVLEAARRVYDDPAVKTLAVAAAQTEAAGYCKQTRVEEIISFARRIEARHIGIACCVGLRREAALAQEIFTANGFEVSTVTCKAGAIDKEALGLNDDEKIHPGQYESACNPVGQAFLLAEAGTELNVVVGLCVGHDALFFRHSAAPVTVLVAKDRVTGHNPVAALYTSRSYYRRLRGG